MRYRLRTLLVLLTVLPPLIAVANWAGIWGYSRYEYWREYARLKAAIEAAEDDSVERCGTVTHHVRQTPDLP